MDFSCNIIKVLAFFITPQRIQNVFFHGNVIRNLFNMFYFTNSTGNLTQKILTSSHKFLDLPPKKVRMENNLCYSIKFQFKKFQSLAI